MNILSLFDGMACGMLAMKKAGVSVDSYFAYEIDKYAIQTAAHNFPEIKELGDVFKEDYTKYKGQIDYLIGGSPCTYWSIAQSSNKRETTSSGIGWELFSQYVRALKETEPDYFIYENNKSMAKAIYEAISNTFGFEPILINSALVSAQNRQRLYWVGKRNANGTYSKVNVEQPEDKGILLKDILDTGMDLTLKNKAFAQTATYNGATPWNTLERHQRNMIAEPIMYNVPHGFNKGGVSQNEKASTLTSSYYQENHKLIEPVNATADNKSRTVKAQYGNNNIDNIVMYKSKYGASGAAEAVCVASRGRYSDIDSRSSKTDAPTYQHLEARADGKTNAVTTVQKDNLIAESVNKPIKVGQMQNSQGYRIYSVDGKAIAQTTSSGGPGKHTGLYAVPTKFENDVPVKAVSAADGKEYTVYEVKDGNITIKNKTYPIKLSDGYYIIRKLTVSECKRLQTVPEWYEFPVSNTQAYKMLGNGWTVDVIAHLIEATLAEQEKENTA